MNRAMDLVMSMTVGVAVQRTAPVVAAVTVGVPTVAVEVTPVSVGMAVPLPTNMNRGLVEIGQRHTGDYADRDSDRQRAVVIGPHRRCGQNSDEKRSQQECTHLLSPFREARGAYALL